MSLNSQLTRKRILECARKEFMEHGYQKANMRHIAELAEVTTGAMYNHFANKSVLFDALVQVPAEEMLYRFRSMHLDVKKVLPGLTSGHMRETAYAGTDWMLNYIYENMLAFRLIFCRSEGTRWASYLEELIAVEEQAYRIYCDALGKNGHQIKDMFLHINASSGFQYLVEIVSHDLPYEQAVAVMDSAKRFGMAGWQEILGLSP
ncbi:TetR family transcriptional regulator [Ruminiclostridium sufflavum DSM 19573]|uniref:TetR family transcriptional regulator n=1 Tax=Ruminiclostridium sufflavum DSM 19573 TaxID=1121337 RepID=A0A318Y1S3_9FIRM|nr:TetR/AcrR family transcriptional regulator [Ruminiclostridium sufflavum]PYG89399.1 TetR family transcriptional regulator [Ruminiclostridium sufflavum DSM 19573]